MPHEHPMPYEYNGRKSYLEGREGKGGRLERTSVSGFLYLGEILEHICFELQRQGTKRPNYPWYPDHPPGHPPEH